MIKPYGGTLDFNGNGVAGCTRCGWRGAPTFTDGTKVGKPTYPFGPNTTAECYRVINSQRSVKCPSCDSEEYGLKLRQGPRLPLEEYGTEAYWALVDRIKQGFLPRQVTKVGRNEPCPCGSGKKYKKCHGSVT